MLKAIFPLLGSILFQLSYCSAAQLPAFEAAGRFGPGAADIHVTAVSEPSRTGTDLTNDFLAALKTPGQGLGEARTLELRECKVLLVRGFMTGGYVEPFEVFGRKVWIGRYFNDQKEVLRELGVDFAMADIDSVMPPAHNAAKVAAEIRAAGKPVIIISHSDGGMYALRALVESTDLAPMVRGFISLQTPFGGSPVADYVKDNKLLSAAMSRVLGHFGATLESLESLTPERRGAFQAANRDAINRVVSSVNIISFASWKEEKNMKLDTLLELPRDFMIKRGLKNDGLVPVDSAILPGSDYIKVEGVDHVVPVMSADMVLKLDRRAFTRALLALTIAR
jgi:pimeloyl-ACP methyl ester carboxylesterase